MSKEGTKDTENECLKCGVPIYAIYCLFAIQSVISHWNKQELGDGVWHLQTSDYSFLHTTNRWRKLLAPTWLLQIHSLLLFNEKYRTRPTFRTIYYLQNERKTVLRSIIRESGQTRGKYFLEPNLYIVFFKEQNLDYRENWSRIIQHWKINWLNNWGWSLKTLKWVAKPLNKLWQRICWLIETSEADWTY